jgi:flagellar biosynthetic protein FliS
MKPSKSELSYRQSAIEGASPLGLVIALLDRLIADLQRAAAALRKDDIETRCRVFDHALLVLAQLESWLDMERASEPAKLIALFYAQIRATMMEAGVKKSASLLEGQIASIVHLRSSWQQLDTPSATQSMEQVSLRLPDIPPDRTPFSLSA